MVGTTAGPLTALNETVALTMGGSGAVVVLYLTEADNLSADEAGGQEDLAETDSGSGVGRMGEEDGLSVEMDARGGKHRRVRCSST